MQFLKDSSTQSNILCFLCSMSRDETPELGARAWRLWIRGYSICKQTALKQQTSFNSHCVRLYLRNKIYLYIKRENLLFVWPRDLLKNISKKVKQLILASAFHPFVQWNWYLGDLSIRIERTSNTRFAPYVNSPRVESRTLAKGTNKKIWIFASLEKCSIRTICCR